MGGEKGVKYLAFMRGGREYAVELSCVEKVIGLMDESQLPKMRGRGIGVTDAVGNDLTVVDPGSLDAENTKFSTDTCILVVRSRKCTFGMLTDRLSDVLRADEAAAMGAEAMREGWSREVEFHDSSKRPRAVMLVDPAALYDTRCGAAEGQ